MDSATKMMPLRSTSKAISRIIPLHQCLPVSRNTEQPLMLKPISSLVKEAMYIRIHEDDQQITVEGVHVKSDRTEYVIKHHLLDENKAKLADKTAAETTTESTTELCPLNLTNLRYLQDYSNKAGISSSSDTITTTTTASTSPISVPQNRLEFGKQKPLIYRRNLSSNKGYFRKFLLALLCSILLSFVMYQYFARVATTEDNLNLASKSYLTVLEFRSTLKALFDLTLGSSWKRHTAIVEPIPIDAVTVAESEDSVTDVNSDSPTDQTPPDVVRPSHFANMTALIATVQARANLSSTIQDSASGLLHPEFCSNWNQSVTLNFTLDQCELKWSEFLTKLEEETSLQSNLVANLSAGQLNVIIEDDTRQLTILKTRHDDRARYWVSLSNHTLSVEESQYLDPDLILPLSPTQLLFVWRDQLAYCTIALEDNDNYQSGFRCDQRSQ